MGKFDMAALRSSIVLGPPRAEWDQIDGAKYLDELEAVTALLRDLPLSLEERAKVNGQALRLVKAARKRAGRQPSVQNFLQKYSISTPQGLALMELAEALLRTPDTMTKDQLIVEKICAADWGTHCGRSGSLSADALGWVLMLGAKWLREDNSQNRLNILKQLTLRAGKPLLRVLATKAMRFMAEQFILGRNIDAAVLRAKKDNIRCSFDILGEGARTWDDADRYQKACENALHRLGTLPLSDGPNRNHGLSLKLSALSPRFEATQEENIWKRLYPRLLHLASLAAQADVNLTLDAEESDRLIISLKLIDQLAREQVLGSWNGLGLALQAYQKRAPLIIERLRDIAQHTGRSLMVRLVKGAYWDSEIKHAQIAGLPDYPVFTAKSATDVSYLVCAQKLINCHPYLYGQFATHNAYTLAAVKTIADRAGVEFEFQRLHGMGETLYKTATKIFGAFALRVYAPIGDDQELLPYLMRRLLENGANSSFVHLLFDTRTDPALVVADPFKSLESSTTRRRAPIPLPENLYGERPNSHGLNLSDALPRQLLLSALNSLRKEKLAGVPIIRGSEQGCLTPTNVTNPYAPNEIIGHTAKSSSAQIQAAFTAARLAQPAWDERGGSGRAITLRAMADALERQRMRFAALCVLEAGKTWADAMAEVREAVDYCRYYAMLCEREFVPQTLTGPVGELNRLELHGRGIFVCISPWNFPLAIFTGQIAAALAAGNAVLAKPAEQTSIIAAEAVRIFHKAGLDPDLLHLVPGRGDTVGSALISHPEVDGVAFTGGTDTASAINRALAARNGAIVPLIAETGGLNAMFVDTTAQREQVIDDVVLSAFGSAGQRCSSLRILFLPEETADTLIGGIVGAMDTLVVGDPSDFGTDIGPVIDSASKASLLSYMAKLNASGIRVIKQSRLCGWSPQLFCPVVVEVSPRQLPDHEVFGPILHIVRYHRADLEVTARALASKGYGLTLGIHSRLESFTRRLRFLVPAGNVYVNRSMIGAVVGVQPFGGEGLSGTGPKAGGPLSLYRYATERAVSTNLTARGGDPILLNR